MAVLDPASLDPLDPRPIYSADVLPGGPWNPYRPRTWVNAHRVTGSFLIRRADGMLVEREGPLWVVQDPVTGAIQILGEVEFSDQYRPVTG